MHYFLRPWASEEGGGETGFTQCLKTEVKTCKVVHACGIQLRGYVLTRDRVAVSADFRLND